MKNATQCAKKLNTLLKKLPPAEPPEFPDQEDPIAVLVFSFLLWESTASRAGAAYNKVRERIVDFNDLRVSMPHEIAEFLGSRYPMALERCERLRAALRNVFLREHAVSLEKLAGAGKREVKKYLESLEGMVPYVSSRVMLLCFDTHAMPVDERLRVLLVEEGAADPDAEVGEISAWITRQIKAGQGTTTHLALQAWSDEHGGKTTAKKKTGKKAATKKTRKTTRTKTAGSAS